MIDQGLATAAIVYVGVLAVGAVVLLALGAWAARSPLNDWAQRRHASRDLRRAAEDFNRTPHPAH
ncbi:hypothetical protein [Cryptosporangium aurantiacum]|uniref:Uncharacterized protein n=1 Tax=Cryptosporangium aurantiacum TaxID=134849 RepID=A0A1M7MRX1_9ACTN|nr:hypothetical protein [Cryptosporangium aurantiacum]SHM93276.1 hypothetical protein SAMN05443668_102223 [Cryptosporangium aurantiacum]